MTATISYDKPVKNLIDQLSETGHVTHTAYRKTSVTLHHNGGRLSHEGVLGVWKTRPASAHFDVDSSGTVAQYVKVNEYAWAVGDRVGNQTSISIEMCNATLSPSWTVADATWKSAARLAGWLFFKVIGERPDKSNLFYHKHWSSTDCAGPYMDKIYERVLVESQNAYDSFKGAKQPTPTPVSSRGNEPISQVVNEVIAGKWGNDPERSKKLKSAGYDPVAVQKAVNQKLSGGSHPSSPHPTTPGHTDLTEVAKDVINGKYGNGPERVRKLLAAHYNPSAVQAEVNRLLSNPRGSKTFRQVADEVIAGKWGNDPERSDRLRHAGYDPVSVQREVNRLLGKR